MLRQKALIICVASDGRRAEERRLLLEQSGYEVLVATSAKTGLEFFSQCAADVALVDHKLPGVDGNLVAAQMKRVKPNVPVVVLAGNGSLPANDLSSADAVITEEGPWSIVLDKVDELVRLRAPFFVRWLEGWKTRRTSPPRSPAAPVASKDSAQRTH